MRSQLVAVVAAGLFLVLWPAGSSATGNAWTQLNLTGGDVPTLAVDPGNSQVIYAGTYKGGVFKSTDGGGSWAPMNNGMTQGYLKVYSLAIDPSSTSTVYAGLAFGHVYRSTDGGASWSEVSTGLPGHDIEALAVDPANSGLIYAAPYDGGVYKSTNAGSSWNPVNTGLTGSSLYAYSLAIDPTAPGTLNAATGNGVFKTSDGGTSGWSLSGTGMSGSADVIQIDPAAHSTLFAGTVGNGIYKSPDFGAHWSPIDSGIPNSFSDMNVRALAGSGNKWYAGTFDGAYVSTDGGASWSPASNGLTDSSALALAIAPAAPSTVFLGAGTKGMFRSTDSAGAWTQINTGFTNVDVHGLAVNPANYEDVFIATAHGIFASTDGGQTWASAGSGLPYGINGSTLTADPSTPGTLWLGTSGGGLFETTDSGQTWANVPAAAGTVGNVTDLAVGDVSASNAVAIANAANSTVSVSRDHGQNFTSYSDDGKGHAFAANGAVTSMVLYGSGSLFVTWADGTFRVLSADGVWTELPKEGLPESYRVNSVVYKRVGDAHYFILGTDQGVFFHGLPISTGQWASASDFSESSFVQALVDPAGTVYAGTAGGGVWANDDVTVGGSWYALSGGLTNPFISSLVHVSNSSLVYAGSAGGGIYVIGSPPAPAPQCVVPNVKGKPLGAAKRAILSAHCAVGKITKAKSKKVPKGRVISESPKAGTKHAAKSKVGLVVSKGRRN